MAREQENLALVKSALEAIASGATGTRLAEFFHPAYLQEEYPNQMSPQGARRDLESTLIGAERGQQLMRAQRWEVLSAIAQGDTVAVELDWSGTLGGQDRKSVVEGKSVGFVRDQRHDRRREVSGGRR